MNIWVKNIYVIILDGHDINDYSFKIKNERVKMSVSVVRVKNGQWISTQEFINRGYTK